MCSNWQLLEGCLGWAPCIPIHSLVLIFSYVATWVDILLDCLMAAWKARCFSFFWLYPYHVWISLCFSYFWCWISVTVPLMRGKSLGQVVECSSSKWRIRSSNPTACKDLLTPLPLQLENLPLKKKHGAINVMQPSLPNLVPVRFLLINIPGYSWMFCFCSGLQAEAKRIN